MNSGREGDQTKGRGSAKSASAGHGERPGSGGEGGSTDPSLAPLIGRVVVATDTLMVLAAALWMGANAEITVWLWPILGAMLAMVAMVFRPRVPLAVVLAAALAGVAAFLGARAAPEFTRAIGEAPGIGASEAQRYDITEGPLPDDATGLVEIRGHLFMEQHLDEYAVPAGERPDQNAPADFLLRLLLPRAEFTVHESGRYLVARLPRDYEPLREGGADVVRGQLRPLSPELAVPLLANNELPEGVSGVLLDVVPAAGGAGGGSGGGDAPFPWFDFALALAAWVMAQVALRGAWSEDAAQPG